MSHLPWVSRERYEELRTIYLAQVEECTSVRARYEALQALVIQRGLVPELKEIVAPAVNTAPQELSPVTLAIREEAQGDPKLARYLHTRAVRLKKEGLREMDIATELRKWHSSETENVA